MEGPISKLRWKAEACGLARGEFRLQIMVQWLQVADEYERLVKRVEEFAERDRLDASNDEALKKIV